MTKDQARQHLDRILPEFLDGYILIGRVAGQSQFVIAQHIEDARAKAGIVVTMANALEELTGPGMKSN